MRLNKISALGIVFILTTLSHTEAFAAAPQVNKSCSKLKATAVSGGVTLTCVSKAGKKVWTKSPTSTATKKSTETVSQINAVLKAKSYLRSSAFSRTGLIAQMEYSGFSTEDATYGVDKANSDWNAQAVLKAKSYLRSSAFSRSGLIDQMEYSGFTPEQAVFGVNATGL
jgi:hypothetical protein